MKKLLLIAILFTFSIVTFAQDTFIKKYNVCITKEKGVFHPWIKLDITVVFNPNHVKDIVIYYVNGNIITLHQITGVICGKTENGSKYQVINCVDQYGSNISLQLFDDNKCLRLFISKNCSIEFHKA